MGLWDPLGSFGVLPTFLVRLVTEKSRCFASGGSVFQPNSHQGDVASPRYQPWYFPGHAAAGSSAVQFLHRYKDIKIYNI